MKPCIVIFVLAATGLLVSRNVRAQNTQTDPKQSPLRASTTAPATPASKPQAEKSRGQKAFEANCSRCHQAPEQLSPRITGTVLMHMRVRASLSKADEKALIEFLAH